jgi:hypothetical protein
MGAGIPIFYGMTATELAKELGRGTDTIRHHLSVIRPGWSFSKDMILDVEAQTEIRNRIRKSKKKIELPERGTSQKTAAIINKPAGPHSSPPVKKQNWLKVNVQRLGLYALMAIPATASVQNMHAVTGHLTESVFSSLVLTALFSVSPFLFVMVGAKSIPSKALVVLMVGYECFCNTMRIYGGLTRFGADGYPTRFLGLVTDFFDSGTYQTARVLAVFMAALAAGIFYIAYWQLNKSKT